MEKQSSVQSGHIDPMHIMIEASQKQEVQNGSTKKSDISKLRNNGFGEYYLVTLNRVLFLVKVIFVSNLCSIYLQSYIRIFILTRAAVD